MLWEENDAIRGSQGYTLTWTTTITLSTPGVTASGPAAAMAGWVSSSVVLAQDSAGVRDAALSGGPEGRLHAVWSQGASGAADIYYACRRLAHVFLPLTLQAFP